MFVSDLERLVDTPAPRGIWVAWRWLRRALLPVQSAQGSCLASREVFSCQPVLLCSSWTIAIIPRSGPFWGDVLSPTALLGIGGVRAVSAEQSVLGLFSARTLLNPSWLQCVTYPKNWWAISQKQYKSKDFLIFHSLWTLEHHTLFSSGNFLLSCASP